MDNRKLYRIGDFAKKLGVTPDLLKYCEKKGIITSVKSENGYRYYDFRQSAQVIEYLKFQNLGFSADEIYSSLHADSIRELISIEQAHREELKRKALFYEAIIERNEQAMILKDMFSIPPKWTLEQRSPAWFIRNSVGMSLLEDEEIYERIEEWNQYLPVVESACCYDHFETSRASWGLYIDGKYAEQFGLDTSDPAEYVPGHLILAVYITRELGSTHGYIVETGKTLPGKLGLRQTGPAFHRVIAKMWSNDTRREYSILNIPVEYK